MTELVPEAAAAQPAGTVKIQIEQLKAEADRLRKGAS